MPQPIISLLGHLRAAELKRCVEKEAGPLKVERSAERGALDTLLFLAAELFNGRGPASGLPLPVQLDIRAFFPTYSEARKRADRLLFKLRDEAFVRRAMNGSSAGKFTASALYVHRRALQRVLRLYEQCASIAAGRPGEWTVVRFRHQSRGVSWLDYPEFDTDPHPRLAASYAVDLRTRSPPSPRTGARPTAPYYIASMNSLLRTTPTRPSTGGSPKQRPAPASTRALT
ncbi:hypothetical protein [Streptomyces sp. CB02460]|uniref:hypothetical protein n=1 Tax=Streptomyces sp. CB02460 TaxID=1703941 RepID=UPI002378D8D4|nr:hypothetical protein [Streptomyces sp. CB02460]